MNLNLNLKTVYLTLTLHQTLHFNKHYGVVIIIVIIIIIINDDLLFWSNIFCPRMLLTILFLTAFMVLTHLKLIALGFWVPCQGQADSTSWSSGTISQPLISLNCMEITMALILIPVIQLCKISHITQQLNCRDMFKLLTWYVHYLTHKSISYLKKISNMHS